jgi:hypothetical protein
MGPSLPSPPTLVTVLHDRVTGKSLFPIEEMKGSPSDVPGELAARALLETLEANQASYQAQRTRIWPSDASILVTMPMLLLGCECLSSFCRQFSFNIRIGKVSAMSLWSEIEQEQ